MKLAVVLLLLFADTSGRRTLLDPRQCDLARVSPVGDEFIFAAVTAPGGHTAAAGRRDGSILLVEPTSGRTIATLSGHEGYVYAVAFSHDGKLLASAGIDKSVRVWDLAESRQIAALTGHTDAVHAVAFSRDRKWLVSAGLDGGRLWNLSKKTQVHSFGGHGATSVAMSPDGGRVATGGLDGKVRVFDVESGKLLRTLSGHEGYVLAVAWHPEADRLVSAGQDGSIRLWRGEKVETWLGHRGAVYSIAFGADGRQVVTGGVDGVRVWDASTGKVIKTITTGVPVYGVALAQGGRGILATCADNRLRLWGRRRGGGAAIDTPVERAAGFLGVSYGNAGGALVSSVVAESQAEKVGFQAGDLIVGIDEVGVDESDDFLNFMKGSFEGQEVWIKIRRGGEDRFIRVKLGKWK